MRVNPIIQRVVGEVSGDAFFLATWELANEDAVGEAVEMPSGTERTVSLVGTLGGGLVAWQGANVNEDAAFVALTNPATGLPLLLRQSPECKGVRENPRYQRPSLQGSRQMAGITVTVLCRTRHV